MSRQDPAGEIGRVLRLTRERKGLSQARLAARVGASQQWLSKLERGTANPTLADVERFFTGLGLRLRVETVPLAESATDPDPAPDLDDDERDAMVSGYGYLLRRLHDVPCLVGGRLAALAHGLPVQVDRLDLIVAHQDRNTFAEALKRCEALRWSERWREFCDLVPADQPGPMRWRVAGLWELRVALVDELPPAVRLTLGDLELVTPPLPWLADHDPDLAGLLSRLEAVGWSRGRA